MSRIPQRLICVSFACTMCVRVKSCVRGRDVRIFSVRPVDDTHGHAFNPILLFFGLLDTRCNCVGLAFIRSMQYTGKIVNAMKEAISRLISITRLLLRDLALSSHAF